METIEISDKCSMLASVFRDTEIETVVGTGDNAFVTAERMAFYLGRDRNQRINIACAENIVERDVLFVIKQQYHRVVRGRNVLIVDVTFPTKKYALDVIAAVRSDIGGSIVGIGIFFNRANIRAEVLGVPKFISLDGLSRMTA